MKKLLFSLLLCLPFFSFSQTDAVPFGMGADGIFPCQVTEQMDALREKHPNLASEAEFENWLQDKMLETSRYENSSRSILTIPIIFHIIHDGENVGVGSNISQAQIQSQIDVLNEDFRRKTGTPGFNADSVGADVEIEFCLALLGPDGLPLVEPGIHRINRNDHIWIRPPFDYTYVETNVKAATIWNPSWYYNVWVADMTQRAGSSQYPIGDVVNGIPTNSATAASTDGTILHYPTCGRVGNILGGYQGRALTHQVGHYLGLLHTYGHGGCNSDDYCADTPPVESSNLGCDTTHISCGTLDMVRNYMNSSEDACQNIFTQCQKLRMRTVLQHAPRRASLLSSPVCSLPASAPTAEFTAFIPKCDATIQFYDSSYNSPFTWFWSFGDGTTSTLRNPIHTYAQAGTYTVSLVVNNMRGTHSVSHQVEAKFGPSGQVNLGADLTICPNSPFQLNARVSDPQAVYHWSPTQFFSDTTVAKPFFESNQSLSTHHLIVKVTDSTGCTSRDTLVITTLQGTPITVANDTSIMPGDSLYLSAMSNSSITSWEWTPNYGFQSSNRIAMPIVKPAQTVTYTVKVTSFSGCPGKDKMKVTVVGTAPLSIDSKLFEKKVKIYPPFPNPAEQELFFSANLESATELSLSLFDLSGRQLEVLYQGVVPQGRFIHKWQRSDHLDAGFYFAVWHTEMGRRVQKIQLK